MSTSRTGSFDDKLSTSAPRRGFGASEIESSFVGKRVSSSILLQGFRQEAYTLIIMAVSSLKSRYWPSRCSSRRAQLAHTMIAPPKSTAFLMMDATALKPKKVTQSCQCCLFMVSSFQAKSTRVHDILLLWSWRKKHRAGGWVSRCFSSACPI